MCCYHFHKYSLLMNIGWPASSCSLHGSTSKVKTWNGFGFSVLRLEICVGSQSGPCRTLIVIPTSCWNMRFHNGLSQVRWHPEWVTHICNKGFVSLMVRADTTGPLDELNRYLHGHAQYIIVVGYIVFMIVFTFLIENRIVDK